MGSIKTKRRELTGDEIRTLLREASLRSTASRVAVYRWLATATGPVTHADLVEALASEGFDRVTLYRNLVDLTEAGLVSRTDVGDRVWRYELRDPDATEDESRHPHFTCTSCGVVSCMPELRIDPVSMLGRGRPRIHLDEVLLKGRCEGCV